MASLLEDKNREYKRVRHSAEEKIALGDAGLQSVLSSNVSAVGKSGKDLIVRFHNGSMYKYPSKSDLYEPLLKSSSKGHFVYIKLRKTNANNSKIGSMPLQSDINLSDERMLENIDNSNINRVVSKVTKPVNDMGKKLILGLSMKQIIIGGISLYTLI